jgi:flavin reductase (DIM6/NTAB) family NADH-FMN oxidoreductase RutF
MYLYLIVLDYIDLSGCLEIKEVFSDGGDTMAETNVEIKKEEVGLTEHSDLVTDILGSCGCLLVAGDGKENNVMTIGWGLVGMLWGKPTFCVLVRKSRHTHQFLEKYGEFTVNVPRKGIQDAVELCGKKSGRDLDKFKEAGLTRIPSLKVKAPCIEECGICYECRVMWKTEVDERVSKLPWNVKGKFYLKGDLHTIYFGEIVAARADEDVENTLHIGR